MGSIKADRLRTHQVTLASDTVVLRPLTEDDWSLLLPWNNDPEVLYLVEGDDVQSRTREEVQAIYRTVSQSAYCFVIEVATINSATIAESSNVVTTRPAGASRTVAVGECWLQEMNLQRLLDRYPGKALWRIDLMIGEKAYWGRGVGTKVIGMLVDFAFDRVGADLVFGCDIADHNTASLRAFQRNGFAV